MPKRQVISRVEYLIGFHVSMGLLIIEGFSYFLIGVHVIDTVLHRWSLKCQSCVALVLRVTNIVIGPVYIMSIGEQGCLDI